MHNDAGRGGPDMRRSAGFNSLAQLVRPRRARSRSPDRVVLNHQSLIHCRIDKVDITHSAPHHTHIAMSITELNELFAQPNQPLQDDVSGELQSIVRLHSISEQELFFKWEAYSIKMGSENTGIDYKTVRDFKKDLQDTLERESRGKAHVNSASKRGPINTPRNGATGDVYGV